MSNDTTVTSNIEGGVTTAAMHNVKPMAENDQAAAVGKGEQQSRKLIKTGLLLTLAAVVTYVVLDYTVPGLGFVANTLTAFLEWVEDNPGLGAVAFATVYIFTTVAFIPGSLLTLGSGLVFGRALGTGLGVLVGSVAVLVGATVGSILAFLLGRFVLRDQAQGLFNKFKVLTAVNKAIEVQGLKLVILLRLSPVVPFSAFNYVMGVTAVKFRDYALGCVGFIPGTVAFVFIGTTASGLLGDDEDEAQEEENGSSATIQLITIIVGGIATVVAVVLISIYSKRALAKVLAEGEGGEKEAQGEGYRSTGHTASGGNDDNGLPVVVEATTLDDDLEAQSTGRPLEVAYPVRHH